MRHSTSIFFPVIVVVVLAMLTPVLRAQEIESETLRDPIVASSDSGAYHAINQLPESIRRSAPFARDFYDFSRQAGPSGTIDQDAYLWTYQQAQQSMLRTSERSSVGKFSTQSVQGTWQNIGLLGSATVNTPSAGITTEILFNPQHANIMYAAGFGGGVWESIDTGATWNELTDNNLPNLNISGLAIDPVSPDTMYVGTGYCNIAIVNYGGSGLYRSMDGGTSFQKLNVGSATSFVKIVVDPANHNIVLASSYDQGNVFRSTDYGNTWNSVFSSGETWDIVSVPGSPGVFFLLCTGGIYKSTNDGSSWTKSSTAVKIFGGSIGRGALAIPTNAPNKVFALVTNSNGYDQDSLYISTDAGTTWSMDNSIPGGLFSLPGTQFGPQGWYDLYLGVSPNSINDDTIYTAGVNAYEKSGGNWVAYGDYNDGHQFGTGGYPHSDHHSFAINPLNSNIVYDGDDGGLYVNYAAGSTTVGNGGGWIVHSTNMITSRFYHVAFDRNNLKATWAGAQDQGLWRMVTGQASTYEGFGDALTAIVNPTNSNRVYGEGPEGQISITNSVSSPNWQPTADSAEGVNDGASWDCPFRMSPVANGSIGASSILYVGRQHLWQTTDGATTWKKLPPVFGQTYDGVYYISAIGLPSWNANMIYVAGGSSSFELSTNFGSSFVSRTNPGTVTSICTNWHDTKFVLVSLEGSKSKVMMSEDSGHSWTNVSGVAGAAIPGADSTTSCNVLCVAVDSTNPLSTWYAATDFGMYQTTDAGQHWEFFGSGLFPCRDVQVAPNGLLLRVASSGRGIWEYDFGVNAVESSTLTATKSSSGTELAWSVQDEPDGATFYIERSLDGDGFTRLSSIAGMGASSGTHNYTFADNTTAPGTYLYQIHEIDASGAQKYSNQVELHYGTNQLYVYQPYPNPFILNSTANAVTLNFEIPAMDNVQLRIYDVKGSLIRTLLNRTMDGGPQSTTWDARDDQGNLVAPGAYFYSIQTGNSGVASGKIMVVRE